MWVMLGNTALEPRERFIRLTKCGIGRCNLRRGRMLVTAREPVQNGCRVESTPGGCIDIRECRCLTRPAAGGGTLRFGDCLLESSELNVGICESFAHM